MTASSHDSFELHAGALRLAVRPDLGGSIAGLWHRTTPLMRSGDPAELAASRLSASYPLVPYSNRLGYRRFRWKDKEYTTEANFDDSPHSLHGVAWLRRWEMVSSSAAELVLRYRHAPDGHWPFAFEVTQSFTLTPQQLGVQLVFNNISDVAQPVGLGWHPYFPKRSRSRLHIDLSDRWESDATQLPTHRVPQPSIDGDVATLDFDNCFEGWSGPARIRDEKFSLQLTSSLPYLVVFTPHEKDYFCVEPVSHVSDAIHMADPAAHGLRTLAPGEATDAWMKLGRGGAVMAAEPAGIAPIDAPASLLGESPLWHPQERVLYWCDIPGHALNRFDPATSRHQRWAFDTDVGSCAPMRDGGLLLAMRDGLWRFDAASGERSLLAAAPYDAAIERFNDGKCSPHGSFWVGTLYEPRDQPLAALYRYRDGDLQRVAEGITVGNGLAWSPDGRTLYYSDTKSHTIYAHDVQAATEQLGPRRVFASFPLRQADQTLDSYGGRPDGAAVDSQGRYWCAMFEGQRLLCLSPAGDVVRELPLPVRCATMPCFGGPDLKTLYITTSREKRPAAELEAQPWAGRVLSLRVDVPGLPADTL